MIVEQLDVDKIAFSSSIHVIWLSIHTTYNHNGYKTVQTNSFRMINIADNLKRIASLISF